MQLGCNNMGCTKLTIILEYFPNWYIKLKTDKMKEKAALIVDFVTHQDVILINESKASY